jgi:hypothetical protein
MVTSMACCFGRDGEIDGRTCCGEGVEEQSYGPDGEGDDRRG